jgi:hypothetical protein
MSDHREQQKMEGLVRGKIALFAYPLSAALAWTSSLCEAIE